MSTVILDSHVLLWWTSESDLVSSMASRMIEEADEVAVAAVSWYELAWLAENDRVAVDQPVRLWLTELARHARTFSLTPGVAATAAALPPTFTSDPADRQIYATAIETGWPLVTKDRRLLDHPFPRRIAFW